MSGAGNAAQSYDFTVTSDAVAEQLKEAQKSGNEVIVHYFSPRTYGLCESSNSNFVDAVEVK